MRSKSYPITKATRGALKARAAFATHRKATLAAVRKATRALVAVRAKIERLLEPLADKLEPADELIELLEHHVSDPVTPGSSASPVADQLEAITHAVEAAFDEAAEVLEQLEQSIKAAKRSP